MIRMGREFAVPNRTGDSSNIAMSCGGASVDVALSLLSRTFSSYNVCIVLVFAVIMSFSMVSGQTSFNIQSTSYNCSSNLICIGDAHEYIGNSNRIEVGRLSILKEDPSRSIGIAYYNESIQMLDHASQTSASFNTSFVIDTVYGNRNGTDVTGDGILFVISADSHATGDSGYAFGFFNSGGVTSFKSIAVEFDTYMNPGAPSYDISDNHVSLDFANITYRVAANTSNANVDLKSEVTLYAWVEYSTETQQLEVRVSNNNLRPTSPLLNTTVNLFDFVDEYMWVGFVSTGGVLYSNYYIGDWTFESYGLQASSLEPSIDSTDKSRRSKLPIIVGVSVGISVFLVACIFIALWVRRRSGGTERWRESREDSTMYLDGMPQRFTYKQLSVATRAFSQESKLGQGGFGSVYSGVLSSSGTPVAVKKISSKSKQGEREFMAEISIISQLRHRNLIQLLGWCKVAVKEKYLLVYELMPNGSLDKVLFCPDGSQTACLSWSRRFNIVTGTAAALDYLHQGWKQQVIHRDIKSSNIMLDEDWNAKLGDFGLARFADHEREAATTMVAGTYGYIAPEVAAAGKFTDKTDIYAFGAVVLEIACGRKALSSHLPEDERILVDWVWQRLSDNDLLSTVDKRLEDYDTYSMEVLLIIGLWCSHPNPLSRPTMRHVVQVLAGDVPVPSIPSSKPHLTSDRVLPYSLASMYTAPSLSISRSVSGSGSLMSMNSCD